MTHSAPARASARPLPVMTSTPLDRDIRTTSCPRPSSTSTTCRPTRPVAPATPIFIWTSLLAPSSSTSHDETARLPVTPPGITIKRGRSSPVVMADHSTKPVPGSLESEIAAYRPLAFAIAYRMLGSVAETEDIVQEAFLRLHRARQEGVVVESPKAYLSALTTRLAIDHL